MCESPMSSTTCNLGRYFNWKWFLLLWQKLKRKQILIVIYGSIFVFFNRRKSFRNLYDIWIRLIHIYVLRKLFYCNFLNLGFENLFISLLYNIFVRYFGRIITIIWDENVVYFFNWEKNQFWTNKKFVYLIFINKLSWYHPKITYKRAWTSLK